MFLQNLSLPCICGHFQLFFKQYVHLAFPSEFHHLHIYNPHVVHDPVVLHIRRTGYQDGTRGHQRWAQL